MLQAPEQNSRVYYFRALGKKVCETQGSDHYKGGVEPIDLYISKGIYKDFFIGNIIKYAARFKTTNNLEDLKKVADYAHLLCGVEVYNREEAHANEHNPIPGGCPKNGPKK